MLFVASTAMAGPLVASTAMAAPRGRAAPAPEPAPGDDVAAALAAAETLYEKGRAKFETADYAGAIEHWTEAYQLVPDAPEAGRIKALLIYNIATARERAFEIDEDPQQLRQAKILLESFEDSIPDLYDDDEAAAAERTKVAQRIASIDARLRKAEDDDAPPPKDPAPAPGPADPAPDRPSGKTGKPLIIAGSVLLATGVAGLAVMGAGLGIGARANDISDLDDDAIDARRDRFARGRMGNAMAVGGGVAGGVLVITGAVLVGLGVKRNRSVDAGPWIEHGTAGLSFAGRF